MIKIQVMFFKTVKKLKTKTKRTETFKQKGFIRNTTNLYANLR